ncbi:MAG: crosslink repair DNA glycosylase YcaQ family protein, partial [Pseudomonadales bacterium]
MNAPPIHRVESRRLRRIALDAQGLLRNASFGRGRSGALKAIEHLGYVQIDTISVVERAHHHTLWARVPNYRQIHLEQLVRSGKVFEYWAHAAAYLPMRDYRYALPRMQAIASGQRHWFRSRDKSLIEAVLERIRTEGALRARDFETPDGHQGGWWRWKPAKRALEQLFMEGRLMAAGRDGFEKIYDLPERVLTNDTDTSTPTLDEYAEHLVESTTRALGFAQAKECVYHRRGQEIRDAVNGILRERVDAGVLVQLRSSDGGGIYYARPAALEQPTPRTRSRVTLLCPFDNVLIQRDRANCV